MEKEIYLLDEPTSNVDEETEEKMVELISERLRGKTVIIVTHRPRVCGICDREYRFENGTMFEVKAEIKVYGKAFMRSVLSFIKPCTTVKTVPTQNGISFVYWF